MARKKIIQHRAGIGYVLGGSLLTYKFRDPFRWLEPDLVHPDSKILDVGCGYGDRLLKMYNAGFKDLTGIDPFISKDISYDNGINIYKKYVHEISGKYDLVMLHHAFEHMENPLEVFIHLKMLLKENGVLLIRIPLASSQAWKTYGVNWVELDAPRHFFLHTVTSIRLLAEKCTLTIDHIKYDSTKFEIIGSEKYKQDIPLHEGKVLFTKKQEKEFAKRIEKLNQSQQAGRACFYLTPING